MKKIKAPKLKINVLSSEDFKRASTNALFKDSEVYILSKDSILDLYRDLTSLSQGKQNKLHPKNTSILLSPNGEIEANIDLSPYYTRSEALKQFVSRNEQPDNSYYSNLVRDFFKADKIKGAGLINVTRNEDVYTVSSSMPFLFDPNRIHIGDGTGGNAGTTIGHNSSAQHSNSVALGSDSVATLPNEVSVGNSQTKRKITNVDKGVEPTDVVTVAQLQEAINSVKNNLTNIASQLYPIGAVYITVLTHNPTDLFGGQWVKLPAGKMLINEGDGFNLNETGGEKEHVLTEAEMPTHAHQVQATSSADVSSIAIGDHYHAFGTINDNNGMFLTTDGSRTKINKGVRPPDFYFTGWNGSGHDNWRTPGNDTQPWNLYTTRAVPLTEADVSGKKTIDLNVNTVSTRAGTSQAHNNMPPYLVVNMWKRVG